jgi:hypothetical protein
MRVLRLVLILYPLVMRRRKNESRRKVLRYLGVAVSSVYNDYLNELLASMCLRLFFPKNSKKLQRMRQCPVPSFHVPSVYMQILLHSLHFLAEPRNEGVYMFMTKIRMLTFSVLLLLRASLSPVVKVRKSVQGKQSRTVVDLGEWPIRTEVELALN